MMQTAIGLPLGGTITAAPASFTAKVCLLGDSGVGKTSLMNRFVHQRWHSEDYASVSVVVSRKTVQVPIDQRLVEVNLLLWDLAAGDVFRDLRRAQLAGAAGAVLVGDLTRPDTVARLTDWAAELRAAAPDAVIVLAGNKSDSAPPSATGNGMQAAAEAIGAQYFLTSAVDGTKVEAVFRSLAVAMVRQSAAASSLELFPEAHTLLSTVASYGVSGRDSGPASLAADQVADDVFSWLVSARHLTWLTTDRQMIVQTVSDHCDDPTVLTGLSADCVGSQLVDAVPELVGLEHQLRAVLDGEAEVVEMPMVLRHRANGTIGYVDLFNLPLRGPGGDIAGILHIMEDHTSSADLVQQLSRRDNTARRDQERLSEQLMDLRFEVAELEWRIAQRGRLGQIAMTEAQSWLASILAYSEILDSGVDGPLNAEQTASIGVVIECATQMSRLVKDLTDLGRIEAGPIQIVLEPTTVTSLIENVVWQSQALAHARQQTLAVDMPHELPLVLCDAHVIRRVLATLVAAALTHGPEGGEAQIMAQVDEPPGSLRVEIRIDAARTDSTWRPDEAAENPGFELAHTMLEAQGGNMGFAVTFDGVAGWFTVPMLGQAETSMDADSEPSAAALREEQRPPASGTLRGADRKLGRTTGR